MTSGPGSVDLEGSSTNTLHVRNLDLGTYVFTLTVTDTAGHTSSDDVTVSVQPEKNEPPVANAGGNLTVLYPKTVAELNGKESTDDYRIDSYHWTQIRYICNWHEVNRGAGRRGREGGREREKEKGRGRGRGRK